MSVVSIASAKGGCGKSTLALLIGAEFALDGYKVALLDCDLNQHASAFGLKAKLPNLTILPDIGEADVLKKLRESEKDNDLVLIDLPGGSSTLAFKALQRSHFVLVPTQPSLPDARDAMKTVAQIDDAEELARMPIPRALVWTRFLPGFESRVSRHIRQSMEGEEVPILKSALMERAAFREIHLTGKVPRQVDPKGAAAANVTALTKEVLERLQVKDQHERLSPINDELRPRAKLKKHSNGPATDEEIEANSRRIGEKWGAATHIPVAAPEPTPAPMPEPPLIASVVSIRGYIPQYLDDELSVKAAERRVTKTFLIMEALAKAGYHVAEADMVQDRRKRPKGN